MLDYQPDIGWCVDYPDPLSTDVVGSSPNHGRLHSVINDDSLLRAESGWGWVMFYEKPSADEEPVWRWMPIALP